MPRLTTEGYVVAVREKSGTLGLTSWTRGESYHKCEAMELYTGKVTTLKKAKEALREARRLYPENTYFLAHVEIMKEAV